MPASNSRRRPRDFFTALGPRGWAYLKGHFELLPLLALSGVLNLWDLSRNGYANTYYSAAVKSMSSNWHNFLFASFDSHGVMSVDKPPLALWLQALSVREFGFNPWSYLVPEAVLGTATVLLVYGLTRRYWGRVGATAAGLALTLTPIFVAMARHNNPDMLLIFCSVAAVWCAVRGFEHGKWRWIIMAGLFVGLGFETKMGEALLVVPGIALGWLFAAQKGRRLLAWVQLQVAGVVAAVVALAWPVFVTLTPASQRPWVASTNDNSIWSLIMNYNGVGRITGQAGGPAGLLPNPGPVAPPSIPPASVRFATAAPPVSHTHIFTGSPGATRLLNASLGGQSGWLLGLAVAGLLCGVLVLLFRGRGEGLRWAWLSAVGLSFLCIGGVLSVAQGIVHPYYVSLLSPFVAILVGAFVALAVRKENLMFILTPLGVAGAIAAELLVRHNVSTLPWLPQALVLAGAASLLLFVSNWRRLPSVGAIVAVAALLVAPAVWSAETLGHATDSTFPAGGPASQQGTPPPAPPNASLKPETVRVAWGATPQLISMLLPSYSNKTKSSNFFPSSEFTYIRQHGGGMLAVGSQSDATQAVFANEPIVAVGGFSGQETEVSLSWLAAEVSAHNIRWIDIWGSRGKFDGGRVGDKRPMAAVKKACRLSNYTNNHRRKGRTLYDCRGDALRIAHAQDLAS